MRLIRTLWLAAIAGLFAITCVAGASAKEISLSFYYPIAVSGPLTGIVNGYVAEFNKENPATTIKAIYSGTYQDTLTKTLTQFRGGHSPDIAVLLSTDMFTLIDASAVLPFDTLVKTSAGKAWLNSFYPAFMANSRSDGKTWGIPFQRSTVVMFWNKAAFKAAGLDPNRPPATWKEVVADGEKLTKRGAGGAVTQWGIEIPSGGIQAYWLFQGLTTANDVRLMNAEGTETYFDNPKVIQALQFWVDLSHKYRIEPRGTIAWSTTPEDFLKGKTAIMWTSTGNLTNVKNNAKFPFGVAMLPGHDGHRGSPTGGGNFYLFKGMSPAEQAAALKFVMWMTTPERAADWSIRTGYVATRPDAWKTPAMQHYVAGFPEAAVARDQLTYAVPELSTHDGMHVMQVLNNGIQAALAGSKTPTAAMQEAQRQASQILRRYK